jgi:Ca2+-binding EF-hand superfamily protein
VLYFYSFLVIVNMIFMNLFIAVIIEGFDECKAKEERLFTQDTRDHFMTIWSKYDPEASGFIHISSFKDFMFSLGSPLGFKESLVKNVVYQQDFIASLDLDIYSDFEFYNFYNVLQALSL